MRSPCCCQGHKARGRRWDHWLISAASRERTVTPNHCEARVPASPVQEGRAVCLGREVRWEQSLQGRGWDASSSFHPLIITESSAHTRTGCWVLAPFLAGAARVGPLPHRSPIDRVEGQAPSLRTAVPLGETFVASKMLPSVRKRDKARGPSCYHVQKRTTRVPS